MNRGVIALVIHSLRRIAGVLPGLSLLLAGFEFMLTQVAASMTRHSIFSQQAAVAHAMEISTGGPPIVLIAEDDKPV
jgi:hypothetical protein